MMIALIDYGAGNVRSVEKALRAVGATVEVTQSPADVLAAHKVVLPGVGAFADCMSNLRRLNLIKAIHTVVDRGTPFLGICVGMQVLFEEGEEMGHHAGLGLLPGHVVRFTLPPDYKIPHTGWNQIVPRHSHILTRELPREAWAYFNHSYYCQAQPKHTVATADYAGSFPCIVARDNVYGIQFHPEKSQNIGLHILTNFIDGEKLGAGNDA